MTELLSRRRLNRAMLARQYLLERVSAPAIDTIEHLAGLQAQAPRAPYVGLWTRLRNFIPDELSALTEQRQVVRMHLMRTTVHLVSARDGSVLGSLQLLGQPGVRRPGRRFPGRRSFRWCWSAAPHGYQ